MATSRAVAGSDFNPRRLERVFQDCFYRDFNTRLVGGAPEPLYCPAAGDGECHIIHYRGDYFASALHEVAHWCIAGPGRAARFAGALRAEFGVGSGEPPFTLAELAA